MKISELKAILDQYLPDMQVIVAGHEGGYNDLSIIQKRHIQRDVHAEDYMGQHDDAEENVNTGNAALLLTGKNLLAGSQDE